MATAVREALAQAQAAAGPPRGKLVALEGIDGSGKSTLAKALHQRLVSAGVPSRLTREPTDSWLGQAVKRALRDASDPFVEAFLFLADHADHVQRVQAWLEQGQVVVTDRYGDSCLAYQAASLEPLLAPRGARALDWLMRAQEPIDRPADLTLLLDLAPQEAVRRLAARTDRVKFEEPSFLARVRANYLELAGRSPRYVVLDATMPQDELLAEAWSALQAKALAPP